MKKIVTYLIFGITFCLCGCSSNDYYNDVPAQIQSFISQYYPNSDVESYTSSQKSYTVIIKNGPTITFDTSYQWTRINGNGSVLPQVLLFNDFPPELYEYLQETENTNNVFSVSRNSQNYVVELLKYTLTYDIASGEITGKEERPDYE